MSHTPSIVRPPREFEKEVAEIAYSFADKGETITKRKILIELDSRHGYSKWEVVDVDKALGSAIQKARSIGYALWIAYARTAQYRKDYKEEEYYLNTKEGEDWKDQYYKDYFFRTLYDLGIYSPDRMEASMIEARLFAKFLKRCREASILFLIAGRGVREYRIPKYHDYCFYRHRSKMVLGKMIRNSIEDDIQARLEQPEGVSLPELEDLAKRIMGALEYHPSQPEAEGDDEEEDKK